MRKIHTSCRGVMIANGCLTRDFLSYLLCFMCIFQTRSWFKTGEWVAPHSSRGHPPPLPGRQRGVRGTQFLGCQFWVKKFGASQQKEARYAKIPPPVGPTRPSGGGGQQTHLPLSPQGSKLKRKYLFSYFTIGDNNQTTISCFTWSGVGKHRASFKDTKSCHQQVKVHQREKKIEH